MNKMVWEKFKNLVGSRDVGEVESPRYEKLPEQEGADGDAQLQPNTSREPYYRSKLFWVMVIGATLLAITDVIVRIRTGSRNSTSYQKLAWTDCGTSPDEARERGCQYEPMQRAWIPKECYFHEPSDEYDVFRDREWFTDTNLTYPSNVDKLESGDELRAYTNYWHDEHCTYVLRKLAIAVENKRMLVNSRLANIGHSNHCARRIAKRIVYSYNATLLATDDMITESILAFESCAQLDWRN